jgi:hypothetical protein
MDKICQVRPLPGTFRRPRKHGKFSRTNIHAAFSADFGDCITHGTVAERMFATLLGAMFYSKAIAYGRIRVLLISSASAELARQ